MHHHLLSRSGCRSASIWPPLGKQNLPRIVSNIVQSQEDQAASSTARNGSRLCTLPCMSTASAMWLQWRVVESMIGRCPHPRRAPARGGVHSTRFIEVYRHHVSKHGGRDQETPVSNKDQKGQRSCGDRSDGPRQCETSFGSCNEEFEGLSNRRVSTHWGGLEVPIPSTRSANRLSSSESKCRTRPWGRRRRFLDLW
ncbi:hypothetical protein BDY17DRAFT_142682 [Neohortaea acidophila]|uniref:Uncharacterized protein n=1 Tax=Neohortaea acidophila TaxID=245834 RepID=A0A6A6PSU2_9PEZI|nr:uncharacterized protein BDY17DRAFT_142682 [Neohortaea acidophila]KAF2483168.1 hypothetical protein BDY17DRAFT_142682 [Neohortaea acidophila]